jgi:hypothetical protein
METVIVMFKGDKKEIAIKFDYNKETEELDYDFVNVPEINETEEADLVTVLANYLLNSLVQNPAE